MCTCSVHVVSLGSTYPQNLTSKDQKLQVSTLCPLSRHLQTFDSPLHLASFGILPISASTADLQNRVGVSSRIGPLSWPLIFTTYVIFVIFVLSSYLTYHILSLNFLVDDFMEKVAAIPDLKETWGRGSFINSKSFCWSQGSSKMNSKYGWIWLNMAEYEGLDS